MSEPLNMELLNELRDIMEDEFPSLLETFLTESQKQYQEARLAFASKNMAELRRAAHSLKGSCGNVGALDLHAMCTAIESQADANEVDGLDELLSQAEAQLQDVCTAVRAL